MDDYFTPLDLETYRIAGSIYVCKCAGRQDLTESQKIVCGNESVSEAVMILKIVIKRLFELHAAADSPEGFYGGRDPGA